jgi:hypothetical protein
MKVKIVTCASYHGTGSSAITDLLSEFENCFSLGDYEFRFIQDPNGISDLEYHLVENNHRLNSSNAIKKYKWLVDFYSGNRLIPRYERYFNNCFKKLSYEYIEALTDLEFKGMCSQDIVDKGKVFFYFYSTANQIIRHFIIKITGKREVEIPFLKDEIMYISYPRENFYKLTKEYTSKLFRVANKLNNEYFIVDQLVPPGNTNRYLRYFDDLRIIAVDRDPRDLYLLEKIFWRDSVIPYDVEDFIKWFKLTREHLKYEKDDDKKVIRIKFEELIYEYESTLLKITEFLGLDLEKHIQKKKKFNPEVSIKNTCLWEMYIEYEADIKKIKEELAEFCYKYNDR